MSDKPNAKPIIIVAPSGSGKTTIAQKLLAAFPQIKFSVSATTRKPRKGEENGKDYFFLSKEEFDRKVKEKKFLEWEEFYNGMRYGTLQSEVDNMVKSGYFPLLDLEVEGALNVKKMYGDECVTIFIQPPSLDELKRRLEHRGTETDESIAVRIERARKEMLYADKFDYSVVNDNLEHAFAQVKGIVNRFITE